MKKIILLVALALQAACLASEVALIDGVTVAADDSVWRVTKLEGIDGNTLVGPVFGKIPLRFLYGKEVFAGTVTQFVAASKQSLAKEYGKVDVTVSGKSEIKLHGNADFVVFVYPTSKGDRFHVFYVLKKGRYMHTFQALGDAPFYEEASKYITAVVQSISVK
jgi:hypothetical protein